MDCFVYFDGDVFSSMKLENLALVPRENVSTKFWSIQK